MDTRVKIVDPARAAEIARERKVRLVTGYFDPLQAAHARRLAEIRAAAPDVPLMVAVVDSEAPILGARARAELVAALAVVDFVTIGTGEETIPAAEVFREEEADRRRIRELIEHVRRRHNV